VLVDSDTGAVIDAGNDHLPLPPASVAKVLTALVVSERLPFGGRLVVSPRAEAMPAAKVDMKAGQTWDIRDAMQALLLVSANDAAVSLAERVGGSLDGFSREMQSAATRLHLGDHPVLEDPAGLDDQSSFAGGNRISARDLAIVTRSALQVPEIRRIVAEPEYRFRGLDGQDHRFWNHNPLMRTYPGAIGVKTGYTQMAGHTLIGAAARNGRTMIAVVMGAPDPTRFTAALLDRGFATPVSAEVTADRLPPVATALFAAPSPVSGGAALTGPVSRSESGRIANDMGGLWLSLVTALAAAFSFSRVVARRRQAPEPAAGWTSGQPC